MRGSEVRWLPRHALKVSANCASSSRIAARLLWAVEGELRIATATSFDAKGFLDESAISV